MPAWRKIEREKKMKKSLKKKPSMGPTLFGVNPKEEVQGGSHHYYNFQKLPFYLKIFGRFKFEIQDKDGSNTWWPRNSKRKEKRKRKGNNGK